MSLRNKLLPLSRISWAECVLSHGIKSWPIPGGIESLAVPSHHWKAKLVDGREFVSTRMDAVYDLIIANTEPDDHANTMSVFQRINDRVSQLPDGHNR